MISKNTIKFIASLSQKKFRDEYQLFVAEGTKLALDLLPMFHCSQLLATPQWINENASTLLVDVTEVSEDELKKISNQKSPQGILAVFMKPTISCTPEDINGKLSLALDGIQDPGNLGTILRVADWFGIKNVYCSENTADAFSPKAVQATMGALARVRVHTVNLPDFLAQLTPQFPVYGTFMDGDNIYSKTLKDEGIIVMGNEGNGISLEVEEMVTERLLIPNFPAGQSTSESLNVGVATALVCAEFRRRVL